MQIANIYKEQIAFRRNFRSFLRIAPKSGSKDALEKHIMALDRIIFVIAGTFILLSLALSQLHHPYWLFFTAFVGLNMLQAGFSRWCLMATILKKLGTRSGPAFE
jgi:hypothetical protein